MFSASARPESVPILDVDQPDDDQPTLPMWITQSWHGRAETVRALAVAHGW